MHHFDPVPHLPFLDAACYLETRLLEVGEHEPCDPPVARFSAPRKEALEFARQLDAAGRLHLARVDEAPADQRMNLIAVYKNADIDRTVWDRRRRNHLEVHLCGAAADMPAGYDLAEMEVPPGHQAFLFCDDISDMYPTFIAPAPRSY